MYSIVSVIAFDYLVFCLRSCYSRSIFFIFPDKLNRLKKERELIGSEIKSFIDKNIIPIDKENEYKGVPDLNSDDLEYLEKMYNRRKNKEDVLSEINDIDWN